MIGPENESIAKEAAEQGLCLHCLGRLFAKTGSGYTNSQRGALILEMLKRPPGDASSIEDCSLCEGLFDELGDFLALIEQASQGYEYETFLVGTRVDPETTEKEEGLWNTLKAVTQEPIKSELNREIGKLVEKQLGKKVDFKTPHLNFVVDTRYNNIELSVMPLYIYGRYRKLERGVPQTKWFCRKCRGRGCSYCGGSGKMYPTSVEELAGAPALEMAQGEDHSFHGMGREDIDARMLGNGRPFVLEISKPRKRSIDLEAIEKKINDENKGRIEVEGLEFSGLATIRNIKASKSRKSYEAFVEFETEPDKEKVYKVAIIFRNSSIQQQTPNRVSHRRADLKRERTVHEFEILELEGAKAAIRITGDSGLYIKELLHGDDGRTKPNFAEEVGVACRVTALDVVRIWDEQDENQA